AGAAAGTFSVMFGLIGQRDSLAGLSAVLVAGFELSLGIYLISKGFRPSAIANLGPQPLKPLR
ncbi:MAG: hypothetical protein RIB86_12570, partial [Imperialibacter sp.]